MWECRRHLAQRHHVTVVACECEGCGPGTGELHRVQVPRLPPFLEPPFFAWRASEVLESRAYDLVVSYGSTCFSADVLWVNSVHRAWLERSRSSSETRARLEGVARYLLPRHLVLLGMERKYFAPSRYRHVITVSPVVSSDLHRLYGVPLPDMTVVPNGFSPQEFSPERRGRLRSEVRSRLGVQDGQVVLLVVANELRRKGFGVLLEAVARLRDPTVHVLLLGRTPPTAFTSQIARSGLGDRLHYVGAASDIGWYHAAADLFVLPTQYEAFCLAIVEALASGLPVITTAVPGAGDLIEPDVNGLVQNDPMDAAELSSLLVQGLDGHRRERWSRSAAASVRSYAWDVILDDAERVLGSVAG